MKNKSFILKTFGCQMNDRDSELVTGMLLEHGFVLAKSEADADIILFNTCSVREHAENKVWSEIGKLKKAHELMSSSAHQLIIGLIGCMAENFKEAAFKRAPMIDLVVGPNDIGSLPELLLGLLAERGQRIAVGKARRDVGVYNTRYVSDKRHANVIIMEGCDNFCSYCIVPHVRGRERSRPAVDIIREITELVAKGIQEVTLLGQNVNSYRGTKDEGRGTKFIDLLDRVNEIDGLERFDFVTSHPKDAGKELFETMEALAKCRKFLHLPVQSGSTRILKRMNRGYTRSQYVGLAKQARKIMPELRLTTDVMVGFPGETDKDFQDTFDLMREVKFDAAYIFKYSPRPHTAACGWPDDVAMSVKKERNQILLEYQKSQHKQKHV